MAAGKTKTDAPQAEEKAKAARKASVRAREPTAAEAAKEPPAVEAPARAAGAEEKAAEAPARKTGTEEKAAGEMTRDELVARYETIYRRCMNDDPKTFDARGAANALEQIGKLLGLAAPKETEDGGVQLTLSEEADALAQ